MLSALLMSTAEREGRHLLQLQELPISVNQNVSFSAGFDTSKHIVLVSPFHESEVDSCFRTFLRIAAVLHWPKDF